MLDDMDEGDDETADEEVCPVCDEGTGSEPCDHLIACYDATFPAPTASCLCPVEFGNGSLDVELLDPLTKAVLRLVHSASGSSKPRTQALRQAADGFREPLRTLA